MISGNRERAIGRRAPRPSVTRVLSWLLTALAIGFVGAMVVMFAWQSGPVWRREGAGFITGTRWFFTALEFGAAPMIYGSIVVAAIALLIAAPIGIGAAVFTSELLPRRLRIVVKVWIELLAGVPSVIYGLLGVLFLREWVYRALEPLEIDSGDTLLTAGVLLAVMILPTVMTLSDDALRSVPASHRQAARALGLTRTEAILHVALPQARAGITAAILLGLGRALGETIAVFLVVGRRDNQWPESLLSLRPLIESGQTLTSKLGGSETNIAYGDPLHWGAMIGLCLLLLLLGGGATFAGAWLSHRRGHA